MPKYDSPPRFVGHKAWLRNAETLRLFLRDFREELGREPTQAEILAAKLPGLCSAHAIQIAKRDLANMEAEK